MTSSSSKSWRWIALALRVILGVIFVVAGIIKLSDSWRLFALAIDSYKILPRMWMVELVAHTLPWFEIVLGLWLIAGVWLRVSATILALLLLAFFSMIIRADILGMEINCGCFGPGEKISWLTLLRDGSMLAGALVLAIGSFVAGRKRGTGKAAVAGEPQAQ